MKYKKKQDKLWICIMLAAFYALFVRLNPYKAGIVILFFAASCWMVCGKHVCGFSHDRRILFFQLSIMLFAWMRFYEYWITSGRLKELVAVFSLRLETVLVLSGAIILFVSFYGLNILLGAIKDTLVISLMRSKTRSHPIIWNTTLLIAVALAQFLQLQRSSLDYLPNAFKVKTAYFLVNIAAVFFVNSACVAIIRNEKRSVTIVSTFATVFSIINYYVIMFHGSPLFPSELANMKTALNVVGGYRLSVSPQIVDLLALYFLELSLSRYFHPIKDRRGLLCGTLLPVVCSAAAFYTVLLSPIALKNAWRFSWNAAVMYGGFACSAANDFNDSLHPVICPDGYDASAIILPEVDNSVARTAYPDIILILNETFCDLDYYGDVQADLDYLEPFYSIDNASYGIAFTPGVGGGTNDSEFELLNSDSMSIMAASAPFNYVSLNEKNSLLLTYLHSLGYSSTAMHSSTPYNYSRDTAYPDMGFDHVFLGAGSFSEANKYGERPILDRDDFQGLISLYEQDVDTPRFYYLLTYQNHGGWEQNHEEWDLVHTTKDFGDLTDDINEYLTSVSLSAEALRDLIDYFRGSERHVIVCMVGDHAPAFINQLRGNGKQSSEESELWKRAVPYMIWANFDCDLPEDRGLSSMTDLVPQLLFYSHMPLTPFYQQILTLHDTFPVRTRFGLCLDESGDIRSYDADDPAFVELRQYLFMEYNGIVAAEDYLPACFQIP